MRTGVKLRLFTAVFAVVLLFSAVAVLTTHTTAAVEYKTYAVVPGPTPTVAPTIAGIISGTTYRNAEPVSVYGSCPGTTMVRVYKNEVLAGATICQNGNYAMQIDLFVGANTIVARAYTMNETVSPDSQPVNVQFLPNGMTLGSANTLRETTNRQPYMTAPVYYRGVTAGQRLVWTITLTGGQAPYAVSIDWGDGTSELISRGTDGPFDIGHTYKRPTGSGGYTVIVRATDQNGVKSYLQFVAIVTGDAEATVGRVDGSSATQWLIAGGLAFIAVLTAVVSYWLGVRRGEHRQRKRYEQFQPVQVRKEYDA